MKNEKEKIDELSTNLYIICRIYKNELVDKNYSKIFMYCLNNDICEIEDILDIVDLVIN